MEIQRQIIKRVNLALIFMYVLYTFWYQYAFAPISGLLSVIGILLLVLSLVSIHKNLDYYFEIVGVVFFVVYCAVFGILVSNNFNLSTNLLIQIIKYCIPLYAIYSYVGSDIKRFDEVMFSILIGCVVLASWCFFKPVYSMTYSMTSIVKEGQLNANVFSSYIMIGVICCTYFLTKVDRIRKIILYFFLFVFVLAQLNAASRRGIIVCLLIIVAYFHSIITLKDRKNSIKKPATIICILVIVVIVICEFTKLSSSFVGLQRLQGLYNGGDVARKRYQDVAMKLFVSSPIFGKGLGAVSNEIGMYSHSLYFELLGCTGLIGTSLMLGYLLYFAVCFGKTSIKHVKSQDPKQLFSRLMFWYCLALFACGIAVVLIYDSYFYIVLALFASARKILRKSSFSSKDD